MASGYPQPHETGINIPNHLTKLSRNNKNDQSMRVVPQDGRITTGLDRPKHASGDAMAMSEDLGIIVSRPMYAQYKTVAAREATFDKWSKPQDKYEMAIAGFIYTGKKDITTCYYCNISLMEWPLYASPWEQHAIASPKCGHLIQCKGTGFIRLCLEEKDGSLDIDACDVIDTVQVAISRNKEAVELANEYIPDEALLKRSIKRLIKDNISRTFTATDIVRTYQELEEDSNQHETRSDSEHEDPILNDSDDIEGLEEANRQLKEPVMCKICYDAIACVITLPCGHMSCCSQCISAMSRCPICRSEIKGTIRALMAV